MKQLRWWVLVIIVLNGYAINSESQQALRIGAGDTIQVTIFDTPELSETATVDDDGAARLPLLDNVRLLDLSTSEAAELIERRLIVGRFMRHPQVTVSILHSETRMVTVLGEVNHVGGVQINTPRSILDILALSGGLTAVADRHINIQRRGQSGTNVPYFVPNQFSVAQRSLDVPLVYPGDTVVVPKVGVVFVLGDVARPGGIALKSSSSSLSLLEALSLAGSMTHAAKANQIRLIRRTAQGTIERTIAVAKLQQGVVPDVQLNADDIVYVPFSYLRNVALSAGAITAAATSATIYTLP